MVHCGYEPSAVAETFGSLRGLLATARLALFGPGNDSTSPENDANRRQDAQEQQPAPAHERTREESETLLSGRR